MASLGTEFVRWHRDGCTTHIFNPAAFSLTLVSLLLLASGATRLTLGRDIAATQQSPPYRRGVGTPVDVAKAREPAAKASGTGAAP